MELTSNLVICVTYIGTENSVLQAEVLTRCFDGSATARLSCDHNQSIWVKSGFYAVAQDPKFCHGPQSTRGKDCLPNELGHRWAITADCNLFSNCVTYYRNFPSEAGRTCHVQGPTYSQIDYECITRLQSDRKTMIEHIFLSPNPSQDVVNDKIFFMSDRYAGSTSGEIGYCQIKLPANSGAHFRLLDLRGRTIPASTDRCPYKLYIISGSHGHYKEWCADNSFEPDDYSVERSSHSESVIDVVFKRMVTSGNAAVWLLMEGKSADGSVVMGMKVTCGAGVVLQSLDDRRVAPEMITTRTTTTTEATGRGSDSDESLRGGPAVVAEIPGHDHDDHKVFYIFKSTMSAKIPGADGIVDNLAITRDSKGADPAIRMGFYSRDYGQQWYLDGQRIRNRIDNKCMAVNDKRKLVLADCADADRTQLWIVQKDLGVLKNAELGDVVEVVNNLPNSGALLGVGHSKNAVYQKFTFETAPTYFLIISHSNGTVATLSSATERSKIVMQPESETSKDNQIFYADKKNLIRTKINNFGVDTRTGVAVALRFTGSNKDNSWTYNSTLSKITNKDETSSTIRVLHIKPDMSLAPAKSTDDPSQKFDIRIID